MADYLYPMTIIRILLSLGLFMLFKGVVSSQERVGPVIPEFGLIYPIPEASVTPDGTAEYKIVIDLFSAADNPDQLNPALNNVARMLNLHAVGGADPEKVDVVLAVHGPATPSLMNDKSYQSRYGLENPNTALIDALHSAGVKITVCGQSMIGRDVPATSLNPHVEVATSMLTTVTTYHSLGYTLLRF